MKEGDCLREWLKCLREKKQLTHDDISNLIGISRSHYTNIENGERTPAVTTAKKIAEVLGFDWTRFYDSSTNTEESA